VLEVIELAQVARAATTAELAVKVICRAAVEDVQRWCVRTISSSKQRRAPTIETTDLIVASPSVLTGIRFTLVKVNLAQRALISRQACARVAINKIIASRPVLARDRCTLKDIIIAPHTSVAGGAFTFERSNKVSAGTAHTRRPRTLVDVNLAMGALEPRLAGAGVPVDTVQASRAIEAQIGSAFVEVDLAVTSNIPRSAVAKIAIYQICTVPTMYTGIALALLDVDFTSCTGKSRLADALITVDVVNAAAIIVTRTGHALVDLMLTHAAIVP